MIKYFSKYCILMLVIICILVGCSPINSIEKEELNNSKVILKDKIGSEIKIYASFYPLYDFAKKVGGDLVDIKSVVGDGVDPHSFDPSPKLIADIEKADIFIYNGLGMEPWVEGVLENLKAKDMIILKASEGLDIMNYNIADHNEDRIDYHGDGRQDPHIWMDPMNAVKISEKIRDILIKIDSNKKEVYEKNFIEFREDIEKLDEDFIEGLKDAKNRRILVSHSAFRYLARRYNLEEIAVSGFSPHEEPSPTRLAALTKEAEKYGLEYIFFEGLTNPKTATILGKEAGLQVLPLYNIEGLTKEDRQKGEDYVSLMYKNLESLKEALVE